MKIFHAAETIKGGVATVMRQIIEHQSMKKDEVLFLIPNSQSEQLILPQCKSYFFKRKKRGILALISFAVSFIKVLYLERPEIIHLHSSFSGVIGRIILFFIYPFYNPIVIYCPHAFSFLMPCSKIKLQIYKLIERSLQSISDKIICTSNYEKKQAVFHGLNEDRLCVIYNGINFIKGDGHFPYKYPDRKNILFVGRLDQQKGYDYLIELIKKLDSDCFEFTIIGESVNDNVSLFKASNVHYLGWMKYENIIPYFKHATLLVMPSRWESFGLVAVEAQSFGLPVIANNCCSLPEVILNNKTGYLFDFDKDLFSVINLLNEIELDKLELMKADCIEFVRERFSANIMNLSIDNLYATLINEVKR